MTQEAKDAHSVAEIVKAIDALWSALLYTQLTIGHTNATNCRMDYASGRRFATFGLGGVGFKQREFVKAIYDNWPELSAALSASLAAPGAADIERAVAAAVERAWVYAVDIDGCTDEVRAALIPRLVEELRASPARAESERNTADSSAQPKDIK